MGEGLERFFFYAFMFISTHAPHTWKYRILLAVGCLVFYLVIKVTSAILSPLFEMLELLLERHSFGPLPDVARRVGRTAGGWFRPASAHSGTAELSRHRDSSPAVVQDKKQTDELVATLTGAYIRLASQVEEFLNMTPTPSMEDATAIWLFRRTIHRKLTKSDGVGTGEHMANIMNDFLSIAFGHILETLEKQRIGPVPSLAKLKQLSSRTVEDWSYTKADSLMAAGTNIALTSWSLAEGTVLMATECLDAAKRSRARDLASYLLNARPMLSPSVRFNAKSWISRAAWISTLEN